MHWFIIYNHKHDHLQELKSKQNWNLLKWVYIQTKQKLVQSIQQFQVLDFQMEVQQNFQNLLVPCVFWILAPNVQNNLVEVIAYTKNLQLAQNLHKISKLIVFNPKPQSSK